MQTGFAQTEAIEPNHAHEILSNDRRRKTINELSGRLEPISLRTLSERIAESESDSDDFPRELRQSVYNSLHQNHLPKLEDCGVLRYDEDSKRVEPTNQVRGVNTYMNRKTRLGITWETYYRTIGVTSLIGVILADLDVGILSIFSPLGFATAFLTVLFFSITYQIWQQRCLYIKTILAIFSTFE